MYYKQMREGKTGKMFKKKNIAKLIGGGTISGFGSHVGSVLGESLGMMIGIPGAPTVVGWVGGTLAGMVTEKIGETIATSPWMAMKKMKKWKAKRRMLREPDIPTLIRKVEITRLK
jgi:hypothetical protein